MQYLTKQISFNKVKKKYDKDAESNDLKLVETVKDVLKINEPKPTIQKYGKGFEHYKSKKPKTFVLN